MLNLRCVGLVGWQLGSQRSQSEQDSATLRHNTPELKQTPPYTLLQTGHSYQITFFLKPFPATFRMLAKRRRGRHA